MKYLIIQEADGSEFPVFCCAPQTHAEMATAWRRTDARKVVAAGFVEFLPTGAASTFGSSDSLDLGPRPGKDAALITAMHLGTVAMAQPVNSTPQVYLKASGITPTISVGVREQIQQELEKLRSLQARGMPLSLSTDPMRTLLTALCLACAGTNGLLLCDWARRGEAALATGAAAMLLGCVGVALLLRQLRW